MYSKKILSTLFLFLLISTNLNYIHSKEQTIKQPSKFEILKKKTSELLNKLKEKNKQNSNKGYEEEIKKLSMFFGILNALITIPSMNKDGKDEIYEMFPGEQTDKELYGYLYIENEDLTKIIKQSFNASIEVEDSLLIDFILRLQEIISYSIKDEELPRAIATELIDLISKRITNKVIKSNQKNRIVRRILRTSTNSLITAASQELLKENNVSGFINNFITEFLINAMSEILGEGIIRTIETTQKEALKN